MSQAAALPCPPAVLAALHRCLSNAVPRRRRAMCGDTRTASAWCARRWRVSAAWTPSSTARVGPPCAPHGFANGGATSRPGAVARPASAGTLPAAPPRPLTCSYVALPAAGNFLSPAEQLSSNGFRTVMEIDALGTFNMSRAAFEALAAARSSLIINISMTLHYAATWWQAHASAAKVGGWCHVGGLIAGGGGLLPPAALSAGLCGWAEPEIGTEGRVREGSCRRGGRSMEQLEMLRQASAACTSGPETCGAAAKSGPEACETAPQALRALHSSF